MCTRAQCQKDAGERGVRCAKTERAGDTVMGKKARAATPTVAVNKQISISRVQNILKQIIREFMHILLFLMQTFVAAHTRMI